MIPIIRTLILSFVLLGVINDAYVQTKSENLFGTAFGAGSRWPFLGYRLKNQSDYISPVLPKSHNLSMSFKRMQFQIGYVFPYYEFHDNMNNVYSYDGKGFALLAGYRYFQRKHLFVQSFIEYAWNNNTRLEPIFEPKSFTSNRYSISTDVGIGLIPRSPSSLCETGDCILINLEFALIFTYSIEDRFPQNTNGAFMNYFTFGISTRVYIAFWKHHVAQ